MKCLSRRFTVLLLVMLGVLFTLPIGYFGIALKTTHAASAATPTVSLPSSTLQPFRYVTVKAHGFAPGERVYAYVVSYNNAPYTYLFCDRKGACTGQLSLYGSELVYGPHTLNAHGITSGLVAHTSFALVPGIRVSPNQGSVGTALEVDGAAFGVHETVAIYYGSPSPATFIGHAICTGWGLFALMNKDNGHPFVATGAPGLHQITVVRQHHTPSQLTLTFHILAPKIQAPASLTFGAPVSTTFLGFGANETVRFHWNANGGQNLGTAQSDFLGRGAAVFAYPSAPTGSYTLTARGETSGDTASITVHTGPAIEIVVTPFNFPGQTITVKGGGFTPAHAVRIYFQTTLNGVVTVMVNTTGAFSLPFTLPSTYNPQMSYAVEAISADGTQHAAAPISFAPPDINLGSPGVGFGDSVQAQGENFAVGETVSIEWDYGQAKPLPLGTTTVDANGQFSATATIPSDPYGMTVTLAAVGQKSHLVATQTYTPFPVLLFPSSVPGGVPTQIQGGDFGQNETVSIQFVFNDGSSTPVATAQTDARGAFSTTLSAPLESVRIFQQITIEVSGTPSGAFARTFFIEESTLSITPTVGISGTTITMTGQGYLPTSSVPVIWYDPSTNTSTPLPTATMNANGQFTQTITAPGGLVSGTTYFIEALTLYGPYIRAAFTAQ